MCVNCGCTFFSLFFDIYSFIPYFLLIPSLFLFRAALVKQNKLADVDAGNNLLLLYCHCHSLTSILSLSESSSVSMFMFTNGGRISPRSLHQIYKYITRLL